MRRHQRLLSRALTTWIILGTFGLCLASSAQTFKPAQLAIGAPVADFGELGVGVPDFVRGFLPAGFFEMSMTEALANRKNYTARWEIPQGLEVHSLSFGAESETSLTLEPIQHLEMRLVLAHDSDARNDVVLSATGAGGVRNFLIGVEPTSQLALDISGLKDSEALYLLSLQPFSAAVEVLADGRKGGRDLDVMAPVKRLVTPAKSGTSYCAEVSRSIDVCLGTSCVVAWAERYDTGRTWPHDGDPAYFLNVDYPNVGDDFHIGTGACSSAGDPTCKQTCNYTRRDDNSKRHRWNNIDNTLFHCQGSTATCTFGCSDTFNISC